jgi:hypothetical protein
MRATITLPLETLKSIIERAREYELVDDEEFDDDDLDDDDDEGDDDDSGDDIDDDDESDETLHVANDDDGDDDEAEDDDDEEESDEEDEAFEDVLEGLTSEELAELLALSWVGEGDYANWDDAIGAARALKQDDIILQLAENPTLSDAIERGLGAIGYEISDD